MISGYYGKRKPGKELLSVLNKNFEYDIKNIRIIERNDLWACLIGETKKNIDPPSEYGNITSVSSEPVFLGTLEEGYRRLFKNELSKGLAEKGLDFFKEIVNNVCAAAIEVNNKESHLYLVSHRIGPGQIYYCKLQEGIVFSSDCKILVKLFSTKPDPMAIWATIIFGAVPEPSTVLSEIMVVPVGKAITFTSVSDKPKYSQTLMLNFEFESRKNDEDYLIDANSALLAGAKLAAELDTSMTVSGGIDSSLFLCLMNKASNRPKNGFMCTFGKDDSEVDFARFAAKATSTNLKLFDLGPQQVLETIRFAAESAMHPFSDFSAIPVAYLLKIIAEDPLSSSFVFDGNGGDDCFGIKEQQRLRYWRYLSYSAYLFQNLPELLWSQAGLWKKYSAVEIAMRKLYQASAPDLRIAPFVSGHTGMTIAEKQWWEDVGKNLAASYDVFMQQGGPDADIANFYTIQLLHVCSKLWTAKALGPAQELGLCMIFPYLWRDVLNSMGKIPWNLKIKDNVVKWPLKKLLEEYLPISFIYREKAGFTPPLRLWLHDERINHWIRNILLDPCAYINSVIRTKLIDRILLHLKESEVQVSTMILNTIWSMLSVELWLRKAIG